MLEHSKKDDPMVIKHAIEGYSYSPMGQVDGIAYN